MSYTSVYKLYKTKVDCIEELKNSHGSAPAIWEYISQKLHGKRFNMFDSDKFWVSYKDVRLDEDEKAVLLSTYDNAFVEIERLSDFAVACKKLHDLIISITEWEWSHFQSIGEIAEKLYKKHDYRCIGLAIGCTSVSDPWEFADVATVDSWGVYQQIKEAQKQTA